MQWPSQTPMLFPSTHITGRETTDLLLTLLTFSFNKSLAGDKCYSRHPNCLTVCCGFGSCFWQVEMARCLEALTTKCVHVLVAKEVGTCNLCPVLDSLGSSLSCRESTVHWTENNMKHLNVDFKVCLRVLLHSNFIPDACSAEGNWSLESVRQLWERSEPQRLVTIHRCGTLTSWWWQPGCAKVCVYVRACLLHIAKCVHVCFPPEGAWRQKFVNGCTDCRHNWDSSRFQTTSDKMGGRKRPEREGRSAKVIHSGTSTGAIFHKIKAPLFRETQRFTATAHFGAVGTRSCGICLKKVGIIIDKQSAASFIWICAQILRDS